jgi:hypothetical protein
MERKQLESAVTSYSYLRGLLTIPLGVVLILAALGNWEWGPLRHPGVFIAAVAVIGAASLRIARYYSDNFGRLTPSTAQQVRGAGVTVVGVLVLTGSSLLLRSRADWSLDLPVNPTAASMALFALAYYALTVGLKAYHLIVWGSVLVAALLPIWGGLSISNTSNVGLVIGGVAWMAIGILDHRQLVRSLGPANA